MKMESEPLLIKTVNGDERIYRWTAIGPFAIHLASFGRGLYVNEDGRAFVTVTHIASGRCAMHFRTIFQAAAAARYLNGMADWSDNPHAINRALRLAGFNVVLGLQALGGTLRPGDIPTLGEWRRA